MTMANLNVCVGIDAGSSSSKLAFSDDKGTRLIGSTGGFDALTLREAAEVFFDEPVFSCVIAVPENFTRRQRDDVNAASKRAGFRDADIITAYEAMTLALDFPGKVLVYDFGASKSDMVVFESGEVIESVTLDDICGNVFDDVFAGWLSDRFTLDLIDKNILRERAESIKITLSESDYVTWREVNIMRGDFERLIHFTVKRAAHTVQRLLRVHHPERFILTGGCANIPEVRSTLAGLTKFSPELRPGLIAEGAALKGRSLTAENSRTQTTNIAARLREIRAGMIEIEDKLTRTQKDRIYMMFRQVEGINDAGIIALMENMIREIREA